MVVFLEDILIFSQNYEQYVKYLGMMQKILEE